MKIHALEGGSISLTCPLSHPEALTGGRSPGDQGIFVAVTDSSISLGQPWLPEPLVALGGRTAII